MESCAPMTASLEMVPFWQFKVRQLRSQLGLQDPSGRESFRQMPLSIAKVPLHPGGRKCPFLIPYLALQSQCIATMGSRCPSDAQQLAHHKAPAHRNRQKTHVNLIRHHVGWQSPQAASAAKRSAKQGTMVSVDLCCRGSPWVFPLLQQGPRPGPHINLRSPSPPHIFR